MNLWRFMLSGSDEMTMPQSWLADKHRLALYQARQARETWAGGSVVRTVADMRHEAFWQAHAVNRPAGNVTQFRKGQR